MEADAEWWGDHIITAYLELIDSCFYLLFTPDELSFGTEIF